MRFSLLFLLLMLAGTVFADAYKCKSATGQTVITATPCDIGYRQSSSAKSDGTDTESYLRAQSDLQRQKNWLSQREVGQYSGSSASSGYVVAPDVNRDAIHACLMKVTAMPGLRPGDEARRKVNCYPGGVGLIEECKSSVVATMRLSTAEEASIKSLCQ